MGPSTVNVKALLPKFTYLFQGSSPFSFSFPFPFPFFTFLFPFPLISKLYKSGVHYTGYIYLPISTSLGSPDVVKVLGGRYFLRRVHLTGGLSCWQVKVGYLLAVLPGMQLNNYTCDRCSTCACYATWYWYYPPSGEAEHLNNLPLLLCISPNIFTGFGTVKQPHLCWCMLGQDPRLGHTHHSR